MQKLKAEEMNRLSAQQYAEAQKKSLIVILDNVRSMHNVGAVFRTADAFRIESIYLCGITCCPPNNEIHKTALGAEMTVDWQHFDNTIDAVKHLQSIGYTVFAIEQAQGSINLQDISLSPEGKYAVVLGHEVFGVDQEVVNQCNHCIEIPQYGTKHSLNVSVTAGIIIYTFANQLKF